MCENVFNINKAVICFKIKIDPFNFEQFLHSLQALSALNYQRDGNMALANNQNGAPNYFPNSFNGPKEQPEARSPAFYVSGNVDRHTPVKEDDFSQSTVFWQRVLDDRARARLVQSVVDSLRMASSFIIQRAITNFSRVDVDLGKRITKGIRDSGVSISESGISSHF